jgi:hypothetical protein
MTNEEFGIKISGECEGTRAQSGDLNCIPRLELAIQNASEELSSRYEKVLTCHDKVGGNRLLSAKDRRRTKLLGLGYSD